MNGFRRCEIVGWLVLTLEITARGCVLVKSFGTAISCDFSSIE